MLWLTKGWKGVKKTTEGDNKELIEVLKRVEKQLGDIKFDLADVKREMPKVPYYGALLQDIIKAIENINKWLAWSLPHFLNK